MTTKQNQTRFLKALAQTMGNVKRATESIHISRAVVYKWRDSSKKFAQDWEDVIEGMDDDIELQTRKMIFGIPKYKMKYNKKKKIYEYEMQVNPTKGGKPIRMQIGWILEPSEMLNKNYTNTKLKHRGYTETIQVEHQGDITIVLSPELKALKKQNQERLNAKNKSHNKK